MIGVAVAVEETFGPVDNVERHALACVVAELARVHGWVLDAAFSERIASISGLMLSSPAALRSGLFRALGPSLTSGLDEASVETMLRMAGMRAAVERVGVFGDVPPTLRALVGMNVSARGP